MPSSLNNKSHLHDSAAIFSPSVARIAASTARDWSYVDTWLASKFPSSRPPPSFERNPDTLKILLALAVANEQADEERTLLAETEAYALRQIDDAEPANVRDTLQGPITQNSLRRALLTTMEDDLPPEGQSALDALSRSSLELGIAHPSPSLLGNALIKLNSSTSELEQMKNRVDVLHRHLDNELADNKAFLQHLQSDDGQNSSGSVSLNRVEDLPRQNLNMQRSVKAAEAQLPDLQNRVAQLAASVDSNHPTIDDIAEQEDEYVELLARKRELDAQLAEFQGLPSDPDQARSELEGLRRQLRGITSRRDQVFEGLVEQASPVRRR